VEVRTYLIRTGTCIKLSDFSNVENRRGKSPISLYQSPGRSDLPESIGREGQMTSAKIPCPAMSALTIAGTSRFKSRFRLLIPCVHILVAMLFPTKLHVNVRKYLRIECPSIRAKKEIDLKSAHYYTFIFSISSE
jgi:hypothetical protein